MTDLPPELLYNILEKEPIKSRRDLLNVSKKYRLFKLVIPKKHYRLYYDLVVKDLLYKFIEEDFCNRDLDEPADMEDLAMTYRQFNLAIPKSYYKYIFDYGVLFELIEYNKCHRCNAFIPFDYRYYRVIIQLRKYCFDCFDYFNN
jgi:hypothetical protein